MYEEELEQAEIEYKGKYNKWTESLQYIAVWSRQAISDAVMKLSG